MIPCIINTFFDDIDLLI